MVGEVYFVVDDGVVYVCVGVEVVYCVIVGVDVYVDF